MASQLEDLEIKETPMQRVSIALKSINDHVNQQNSDLAERLQSCEGQLQNAEARINSLKGQNEAKDTQLKKAAKKLAEGETKYEDLLSKNQDLESEVVKLTQEKNGIWELIVMQRKHHDSRTRQLGEEIEKLKRENEGMINRLNQIKSDTKTNKELEVKISLADEEIGQLKHRNGDLILEIGRLKQEFEKEKTGREDDKKRRQESGKKHLQYLEYRVNQLQKEKEEMSNRQKSAKHHLEAKIKHLQKENEELMKENIDICDLLTETKLNTTKIEQLEEQEASVENENKKLQKSSVFRQQSNRNDAKELEDKVRQLEREKQEVMAKRSAETQQHAKSIEQFEAKLASVENEKWQLQNGQMFERNKMKELEDRVGKLETEKTDIVRSLGESERRLCESEQMLQNALSVRGALQIQNGLLKKQLDAREGEVHNLKQEMKKIKDEKDDLKKRFNEVAALQLTHENPVIVDLSDKYRPTKLGEMYSELYDNEWTEAFSAIEDDTSTASEEGIVNRLRDILLDCYTHCVDISKKQVDNLCAVLVSPNTHKEKKVAPHELINGSSMFVIGLRKQTCDSAIRSIKTEMTTKYNADSRRHPTLKAYIEKCAELCWMMVVQSPPVYIDGRHKSGDRFDNNVFKPYTQGGQEIDFVVWPPVYLHQGGPLLCKGTAQGREYNRAQVKMAWTEVLI